MNTAKFLLLKALDGKPDEREKNFQFLADKQVSKELFVDHKAYWDFVQQHRKKHGVYPDRATFEKKFNAGGVDPVEPLSFYAEELKTDFSIKLLQDGISEADDLCVDKNDPSAAVRVLEKAIREIKQHAAISTDLSMAKSVDERVKIYEHRINNPGVDGIPTHLSRLDSHTYGWHSGEFNMIVAPTGSMKTWTTLAMIKAHVLAGYKVLVATVEMGRLQLARRLDALFTNTRFENIRAGKFATPEDIQEFKDRMEQIKTLADCVVVGGSSFGASFLRSKIEEHKPDIVYVDGLYLMYDEDGAQQHWQQLMNISRELKTAADDYKIPVNATTQLGNSPKGSKGHEDVSDIMYAQALAQNADNIVSLGRIWDDTLEDYTNRLWVKLIKLREGEPCKFMVEMDFSTMTMTECADGAAFSVDKTNKDEPTDPSKSWREREKEGLQAAAPESLINEDEIPF